MKLTFSTFLTFILHISFSQSIDLATEKLIIKETLTQYLNTNPNSAASYIKQHKGYQLMKDFYELALHIETDSLKRKDIVAELNNFYRYSDSVTLQLQNKKVTVQIMDTLYAYEYVAGSYNLKTQKDWQAYYPTLLEDFKENNLHRFDTIIGEEYIELVQQQINYKGSDVPLELSFLNNNYYQYEKKAEGCEKNEFCFQAYKVYRAVFNTDFPKGCYLFSFYCGDDRICRDFIFIKKENGRWIYVDEYPSWIVEET